MPVAHEASLHHPSSSVFSSLGSFLHAFHQSSATHPLPSDSFDSVLSLRLSSLLPSPPSSFLSLPSLSLALSSLLSTQLDVSSLLPSPLSPPSPAQSKMMDEFLDRSVKLLDVCNAIREQISEVEGWLVFLKVVLQALGAKKGSPNMGQLRRASRVLAELQFLMDKEREGEVGSILSRSPYRFSGRRSGDVVPEPQRWRSWHGNFSASSADEPQRWRSWPANSSALHSHPSRQLQAMSASLTPPKLSGADVDENVCSAIYALNVVSIFFLSTILSAFPNSGRSHIVGFSHPRTFLWAGPLLQLQEQVHEESLKRGKKSGNARLWELDQVFTIIIRLSEITDSVISSEEFPLSHSKQEEIRHLVKQLGQHVEELGRDLKPLHDQIRDFYNRLIDARTDVLDRLSHANM